MPPSSYGITLDTSALSHALHLLGATTPDLSPGIHECSLLPGSYSFISAPGLVADFTLTVAADGAIVVDPSLPALAAVSDRTVTIKGYRITLNTSALSHALLPFLSGWSQHLAPGTHEITLVPAKGYQFMPAPAIFADFTLTVKADGAIVLDPPLPALAAVSDRTVTIKGYRITLDTSPLSHALLPFLSGWSQYLAPGTHEMTLLPAKGYQFMPAPAIFADFTLTVKADGAIVVDPPLPALAAISGRKVTIKGYRITLDTSALSHALLPFLSGWSQHLAPGTHEITLLPAKGYQFMPAPSIFADFTLTVKADGAIVVDPSFPALAAVSDRTVTIKGYRITLNTSALSHALLPFLSGWSQHLAPGTHEMTLVPAAGYGFLLASGITADFRFGVDVNGRINLETEFAGFAGASGSKLWILGYPMVLDAVHADSDLMGIAGLGVQPQAPRELRAVLIPAKGYCPQTANGVCRTGFNLERDGSISFDPVATGSYVIRNSFTPNPSEVGEEISVGAYVRAVPVKEETPMGNLSFVANSRLLGGAMLDSNGRTDFRGSGLPSGEHDVLIEYLGDANFRSSSAAVRHRVE